jgi:hypothetical protein
MDGGLSGSPDGTTVERYVPADYKRENVRQWMIDTKILTNTLRKERKVTHLNSVERNESETKLSMTMHA